MSLLRIDDVAGKKNYAGGLNASQHGRDCGRNFGAIESNDQQLANLEFSVQCQNDREEVSCMCL